MSSFFHEQLLFASGYSLLGAIDEAGRGPLAGPVVAACVVLKKETKLPDDVLAKVKDSKKLTAKRREELYEKILNVFPQVGIGICDHETIDRINILQATFLAMKKALSDLKKRPEIILLDGRLPIPNLSLPQQPIIKGDEKVFSVAAASIVAKVTRDRIMLELDKKYPQYGFAQHKGYGTKLHFKNLNQHGPSPVHRRSFKPVKNLLNKTA